MGVRSSAAPFPRPAEPAAGAVRAARGIEVVVTARCQGCGACLLTCPVHAIRPAHAVDPAEAVRTGRPPGRRSGPDACVDTSAAAPGPLAVLDSLCTGCGECVEVCPVDAIEDHRLEDHRIGDHRLGTSTTVPANQAMTVPGTGSDT